MHWRLIEELNINKIDYSNDKEENNENLFEDLIMGPNGTRTLSTNCSDLNDPDKRSLVIKMLDAFALIRTNVCQSDENQSYYVIGYGNETESIQKIIYQKQTDQILFYHDKRLFGTLGVNGSRNSIANAIDFVCFFFPHNTNIYIYWIVGLLLMTLYLKIYKKCFVLMVYQKFLLKK